ncbi:MAG: hypothetical protein CMI54_06400 [Parcubacteria group bacterium]|jgi:hypothetical protein|nr:hypothetical protein [Parcubacteria group bacterium]|tara:strand:+ start:2308 stop:2991 length:684 start_codon:yes stop_codon:yes gene_type:complete
MPRIYFPSNSSSQLTVDGDMDFLSSYQVKALAAPASGEALRKGNTDIGNAEVANDAAIPLSKLSLTGAITNTHVNASAAIALSKLAAVPAVRVYNSANIELANTTMTALTFDSERFDTDAMHSTASNTSRLTCVTAGKYLITANISFLGDTTGGRKVYLRINGDTYIAMQNAQNLASEAVDIECSTLYAMSATDYAEVVVIQSSGAALDVDNNNQQSPEFSMVWVGQ